MRWWFKAHRLLLMLPIASSLILAAPFLSGFAMIFPAATGPAPISSVSSAALIPLVASIATAYSVLVGSGPLNLQASRLVLVRDVGVVLVPIAVGGVAALVSPGNDVFHQAALLCVRNVIGLVGLQLISQVVVGLRLQAVPGVLYVFLAALFGRASGTDVQNWAFVLDRSNTQSSWSWAVGLGVVGLVLAIASGLLWFRSKANTLRPSESLKT